MEYGDTGVKEILLAKYGWKCYYCDYIFPVNMAGWHEMSVDHIDSQSKSDKSDKHELQNLVIACKDCNSSKGSKSLGEEELVRFKEKRKAIRKRDEEWVGNRYTFINEAIVNLENYTMIEFIFSDPDGFRTNLMEAMKQDNFFNQPQVYGDKKKFIKFTNSGNEWFFDSVEFSLQPFFIFKKIDQKNEPVNIAVRLALENSGYGEATTWRTKLLKPFLDIQEGIKIIKAEIEQINEVWECNT